MDKKIAVLFFCIFLVLVSSAYSSAPEEEEKQEPIVIGQKSRFFSKILNEWRPLEIYLPDDFESSQASYPLMIVLDGDWYFQYVVGVVDMISPNYMPRMVVVGLPNTDRWRDLDPYREGDSQAERNTAKFLDFFEKELFVHCEERYRTLDYRILTGHSLAGYFTVYALLKRPALFDSYIASSPGLGIPERLQILADELKGREPNEMSHKYLYFSGGGSEGEALHEGIKRFSTMLVERTLPRFQWDSDIFASEGHVPIKGFYQGLMNIFEGWIPELEFFKSGTLEDITSHYQALTEKYGFRVLPPTDIMNTVGRRYYRNKQFQKSAELYQHFVSVYPEKASGYLDLGKAYIGENKLDRAKQALQRVLELDPENSEALDLLEEIQKMNPEDKLSKTLGAYTIHEVKFNTGVLAGDKCGTVGKTM